MSQIPPREGPNNIACFVRPLSSTDLNEMVEIEARVYPEPWTAQLLEESLIAPMTYSLGVFENERLLGYGIYQVILGEGHLLNLAVDLPFQGKGYGAKLLDLILEDSEIRGASSFYLEVRPSNQSALRLYEKRNFRALMIREKYYRDGEAALIMVRECFPRRY